MADQNISAQFGNRSGTEEQAQRGYMASTGRFGEQNAADSSQAGRRGAEAQPTEAKSEGGRNSGQSS